MIHESLIESSEEYHLRVRTKALRSLWEYLKKDLKQFSRRSSFLNKTKPKLQLFEGIQQNSAANSIKFIICKN